MTDYGKAFGRLIGTIKRLRAPDGCAWDREQTPASLRGNLIEEAFECVSAIDSENTGALEEELGDLYMLASLVACMNEESGSFTAADALEAVNEKLIRRHPHVFGSSDASTVDEIVDQWDRIKRQEKRSPGRLDGYPGLPPLERAHRVQRAASKLGFDWKHPEPVLEKLHEELEELAAARKSGSPAKVEEEVGDLLFTVVNLSRLLGVDPGIALHGTNEKFVRRFAQVEERLHGMGLAPENAGLSIMDDIWNQIKAEEQKASK